MKLVIISHTAYCKDREGVPMGWGATVREIDNLAREFEHVWHIGNLHDGEPPKTFLKHEALNVSFVPLTPAGGHTIWEKLRVVYFSFKTLTIVNKYLKYADAVQLRLPTGVGVYILPWISWFRKRNFILWVKYAGNWNQQHPPVTYTFQRWFIIRNFQRSLVTINGKWPNQPSNCVSFENPCLTESEIKEGKSIAVEKKFNNGLTILFVGRIEQAKGVDKLLEMVALMEEHEQINEVILVGSGSSDDFNELANNCKVKVSFKGGVSRAELNILYGKSHLLILPSASEGFPKVVAEASAYGCVPFVSDVSSLGQYINSRNGHLFTSLEPMKMKEEVESVLKNRVDLKRRSVGAVELAERFTYSYYNHRILIDIIQPQSSASNENSISRE